MKTVIFDIDGTLALIDHRRVFLEQENPDWASFNHWMNIEQDMPNLPIIALLKSLAMNYKIVLVSGRNEFARKDTLAWLDRFVYYSDAAGRSIGEELYMRQDNDNRRDDIVKYEILQTLLEEGHDILFAVDDRKRVVDMWRANGITCLQVAEGDF